MKRNIYTTGECILDVTFRENEVFFLSPGGSKLNTAVSLGRAGLPVHMVSECSDDPVGRFILSFLRSNNVSTEFIAPCGGQVRIAFAFLDADNDAHYTFYKGMQNESPAWKEPAFAQDDLLLFGSFYSLKAENRPNIMKLITAARGSGCILVYDPNYRTPHLRELASVTPSILENIQLADIVRGSDEDFGNIFQTCDPDRIYSQVVSAGGKTLILTQGSREVVLFTEKIRKAYPVPAIRTVSTIGAGDSFNAGLIFEMVRSNISHSDLMSLEEEEWNKLIGTAIAFASHVCTEKSNFISIDFATHLLQ
ncbi:MAG TPA: PfkB family carbohydrate kinase [Bacteroidales bacterium]|nr:PfkB family carbohydrate kinase [Bacteroidales bacterium]